MSELVLTGVPPAVAARALTCLGPTAAELLAEDPWRLLAVAGVRPEEADAFARTLLEGKVRPDDPRRARAIVEWLLTRAARDGHTALPATTAIRALRGFAVHDPGPALSAVLEDGGVLAFEQDAASPLLALERYALAEESLAEAVQRLLVTAQPLWGPEELARVPAGLSEAQRDAVVAAGVHGLCLLDHAPGAGGAGVVAGVAELARARGLPVRLAAPSSSAAERLAQAVAGDAGAVRRLDRGEVAFPAADDDSAGVLIVHEATLLDVEMAAALTESAPDGTHVLLAGDSALLPSRGPGRVFGDLAASGAVPVAALVGPSSTGGAGTVAELAGAVRAGRLPAVDSPDRQVVVVPVREGGEAAHRVRQLVTDSIPRALGISPDQVGVITPARYGACGATHLATGLADHAGQRVFTVHEAMGTRWPAAVIVLPGEAAGLLSRSLVYTALTRGSRHVSIVDAAGPVLARAVATVGGRRRHTRLVTLLSGAGS